MVNNNNKYMVLMGGLIFIELILALLVGWRDLSIGTDTLAYSERYSKLSECLCFDLSHELGFQFLAFLPALLGLGVEYYFFIVSLTIFLTVNFLTPQVNKLLFDTKDFNLLLTLSILSFLMLSPFFVSAHINAIRQGLASLVVFIAFFSLLNREWKLGVFLLILSIFIHYSSIFYAVLVPLIFLRHQILLILALCLSALYVFGMNEFLLKMVSSFLQIGLYEKVKFYQSNVPYKSGIRYDFLIFSWGWVIAAYISIWLWVKESYKPTILKIINIFYVLVIPFLVFGFANFSNRYAYPAWLYGMVMFAIILYATRFIEKKSTLIILCSTPLFFIAMLMNGFAK